VSNPEDRKQEKNQPLWKKKEICVLHSRGQDSEETIHRTNLMDTTKSKGIYQ